MSVTTAAVLLTLLGPPLVNGGGPPAEGLTLYQPNSLSTAYLINMDGSVEHSWAGSSNPGVAVYLDGTDLIRTLRTAGPGVPGGSGGAVERVAWDGTVLWAYSMNIPNSYLLHHDIELLPNGNLLMLVWDYRPASEAYALGRQPGTVSGGFLISERIIEVEPFGPSGGTIVWEWFAFDHLVQDRDASLPGYAIVADHPELSDINYPPGTADDWIHFNSIDYNAELDQILVSANYFYEVWVIDHSTTTEEAASHTGGLQGKGGDLLYRWGNPIAYDRGAAPDQVFFYQHDAQWVEPGRPGEGNILVFNNGNHGPGDPNNHSEVDEFAPPVDDNGAYALTAGAAYGPSGLHWSYVADPPASFFSPGISGCQRMPNGNTLIISGVQAWLFEVQPDGTLVWEYTNPYCVSGGGPGGSDDCRVFKARRYHDCPTPLNFCATAPNTQGTGALMGWEGSPSFETNDLVLVADGAIPNQPGIFYFGLNEIQLSFGNGWRCVADGVTRLPVVFCDGAGRAEFPINLWDTSSPLGALAIGDTWKFQFWFRDPSSSGPASFNLSDGLSVVFCP
jgi:hypothetical protein